MQFTVPSDYAAGAVAFRTDINADKAATWEAINYLESQREAALTYLMGDGGILPIGTELAVTGIGTATYTMATGVALVKGVIVEVTVGPTQGTLIGGTNYLYLTQAGVFRVSLSSTDAADEIPIASATVDGAGEITDITMEATATNLLIDSWEANLADLQDAIRTVYYPFPLPAFAANSTVTQWLWHADAAQAVAGLRLAAATLPVDADGTCTVLVKYWDASADAAVALMDAAFNAETLASAKEGEALTLTATVGNLTLAAGDYIYVELTNNSVAIDTPWVGAVLTIGIQQPPTP